jgi:hypothetical protein
MKVSLNTIFAVMLAAAFLGLSGRAAGPALAADDPRLISVDEAAPESDPAHNSDPGADLTYSYGWVAGDTLVVEIDFASDWSDIHLMLALERNRDTAGGPSDPFEFEVFYGYEYKPDYVFTYKYSANDYADLRRWNAGAWEWWALDKKTWVTDPADPGKNALPMITKGDETVRFALPFDAIGDVVSGDTLRIQTYVTQEPSGVKYNALDSNPNDATNDMIPDTGNWWDTATQPDTLSIWAEWVIPEFGTPPLLSEAAAAPDTAGPGDNVLFTVSVLDAGGGIGDVTVDLSPLEGEPDQPLSDDGTGGDETPSDGIYSTLYTIPEVAGGGTYNIHIQARDGSNFTASGISAPLIIETQAEIFISVADSLGDDHGPNHTDSEGTPVPGLYYYYPTNRVFYPGVFDIEQVEFMIESNYLVARVHLGEVTSNSQVGWGAPNPGASCTNPNKAQFNLQKIDIFIDSEEGTGATAGFANRWADIAYYDAWEFAASVEGWWKSLVASNNQNEVSGWTFNNSTDAIDICNDYVENWVDVKIGLGILGLLGEGEELTQAKIAEIEDEVKLWDFIICVSGHDGDSNNSNQGGIRAVNKDRAEWQFYGGRNSEGGRERDSNIIDILAIPGEGKVQGRTQEEMLDYTEEQASERFSNGEVACRLEAQGEFPGSISGAVTLSDAGDDSTVITVLAYLGDELAGSAVTPPGGGDYKIRFLPDGFYEVEASGPSYRKETVEEVMVVGGAAVQDVDFYLTKVTGAVLGTVAVSGFPADVEISLIDPSTGEDRGTSPVTVEGGTGPYSILIVEDGTYSLEALAIGYGKFDSLVTITNGDTAFVDIVLNYTRATHYVFVDTTGAEIYSEKVTVSIPDSGLFTYQDLLFEPRDNDNIPAIADSAAYDSITVRATLLDPSVPPRGDVVFAADDSGGVIIDSLITREMVVDGYGRFWVRDDSLEVLRIEVAKGDVSGFVELRVKELEPDHISITPDTSEITACSADRMELGVQLLDDVGNPIPVADVGIRLVALSGDPIFSPTVGYTNGNGYFQTYAFGLKAGEVVMTARPESNDYADLTSDTLQVVFQPNEATEISAAADPPAVEKLEEGEVLLQVVDACGNAVSEAGVEISLTVYPPGVLDYLETPVMTGAGGAATARFTAGGNYGFATISGEVGGGLDYPVESVTISVSPATLIAADEAAPESHVNHNSLPEVDLTNMYTWVMSDTLYTMLDFESPWSDVHLMVIVEKHRNKDGGDSDPFEFPINYRHTWKPDFVFTVKYSSRDYADLRRWNGGWQFWQLENGNWTSDGNDPGKNAISIVTFTPDKVYFKFPLEAIGDVAVGDTMRFEAYVTQEPFGVKYNALDSTPQDNTNDMIPNDGSGEWWKTAEFPVSLSQYAQFIVPDYGQVGSPPILTNAAVTPDSTFTGETVKLTVDAEDSGGGVGDVYADLSHIGGEQVAWLYDNGTNGDVAAGDNTYTSMFKVPTSAAQGIQNVIFFARDSLNLATSSATAQLKLVAEIEPFITVADSIGDDHGPNHTDIDGNPVDGLWYVYPTNGVFYPGVFDIEQLDFFIDGSWLLMRVKVGDIPESRLVGWNAPNPGSECTNPNKADLNLQKLDIYIDSEENVGATAGLTNRMHDISRADAWEYAVAIEGWWKGFIKSNGENATASWTISKIGQDMIFCTDYVENNIEVKVSLAALGLIDQGEEMTEEVIDRVKQDILQWDFIFALSSHDGDSNDENQGGIRWVNRGVSEWQFGGGRDEEAGRNRDPNIIDVATVPGLGKQPGRPQEDMLNYEDPVAVKRFDEGLMACVLEATFSEDVSPPRITPFNRYSFGHAPWRVMRYSPASFWTMVEDESDIEEVLFKWRPLGRTQWNVTEMGNIVNEYWVADIEPDTLFSRVSPVELVNGVQGLPFEAEIYARDEFGNEGKSEFLTFGVSEEKLDRDVAENVQPGDVFITYDGTFIIMPDTTVTEGYDRFDVAVTPMSTIHDPMVDLDNLRGGMNYLDVARIIGITGYSPSDTSEIAALDNPVIVALHYPSYLRNRLSDQNFIGLFDYNDFTQRWISIPGSRNEWGTAVRAQMFKTGTFGLFTDTRLGYDSGVGLSSVAVEPNPFSPNGDGLYDETRITFMLSREADWVTIEIYDIRGDLVRTITWQSGATTLMRDEVSIEWDGRDDNGLVVPYGIYVMRVEARFKVAPNLERSSIPVVVIK